jgi:hypothetical protein
MRQRRLRMLNIAVKCVESTPRPTRRSLGERDSLCSGAKALTTHLTSASFGVSTASP